MTRIIAKFVYKTHPEMHTQRLSLSRSPFTAFKTTTRRNHRPKCRPKCRPKYGVSVGASSEFGQLADWVDFYGGHVDSSLTLSESPKRKCRGVLASETIDEDDLASGPLIEIPDNLRMTMQSAMQKLDPILTPVNLPTVSELSNEMQVALLLAFEKKRGRNSMWFPYIETLPESPPNGWNMSSDQFETALSDIALDTSGWSDMAAKMRKLNLFQVENALDDYGDALDVDVGGLLWALGHVQSRAYDEDAGLTPVVDLINHSQYAAPPIMLKNDEGVPVTCISSFYSGAPYPLQQGDELLVSYSFQTDEDPLTVFLASGFVPEELVTLNAT